MPGKPVQPRQNILICLLARQGDREMKLRTAFVQDQHGLQEGVEQAGRLAAAAARQDQDVVRIALYGGVGAFADDLDQRVSAEMGLQA